MPRILIVPDGALNLDGQYVSGYGPVAEVITLSEIDSIYAIRCTGDGTDECPPDIEPGDTWSNFGDCIAYAVNHIGRHEGRPVEPARNAPTTPTRLTLVNSAGQMREVVLSVPRGGTSVVVETGEIHVSPGMNITVFSESLACEVRS